MTHCAYTEITDGSYQLYLFEQNQPVGPSDTFSALMMARPDFDIKSVELPPVSDQDIPNLLKFKLRSIYPGNPDETAFDYTILSRKNKKYAVLFITEKRIIEQYQSLSGEKPLFLPFTLIKPLIKRCERENCVFIFFHTSWIELMLIQDSILISSFVINRHSSFKVNFRKLKTLLPDSYENYSLVCVCPEEEESSLEQNIKANLNPESSYSMVVMEELLKNIDRKTDFLFSEKQKRRAIPNKLFMYLYPALFLILTVLIFNKSINQKKTYYSQLENRLKAFESQTLDMITLEKEVKTLEDEWIQFQKRAPHNLFFMLSELSRIMEERAVITYFVIEKDSFQFEAIGQNPLDLMEKFKRNDNFQNIKLLQSIPVQGTNKERFKVIGSVKNK
ncbi:MAG: hypothetical protein AMS17_16795 [Spirochaetes bacterium DG_61]|nr:MAG: hypothetical protein AMS17_16795 [Spirochaetes bacterium DG_61]